MSRSIAGDAEERKHLQVRFPASLATEVERVAAATTGTISSYLCRAAIEQIQRDSPLVDAWQRGRETEDGQTK